MYDFTPLKTWAVYIRHNNTTEFYSQKQLPQHLAFTDKSSYLEWVADWKAEYAKLTQEIRSFRHELSQPHQIVKMGGYSTTDARNNQAVKQHLRNYAYSLLLLRQMGKRRSFELKQSLVV